jgi:acyl-coenzyme A synthetase/AMP-(fatty) acid ligase
MHDCEAKVLLTASGVMRGNKKIDLKAIADSGLDMCEKQGEQSAQHHMAGSLFRAGALCRAGRKAHSQRSCEGLQCSAAVLGHQHPFCVLGHTCARCG